MKKLSYNLTATLAVACILALLVAGVARAETAVAVFTSPGLRAGPTINVAQSAYVEIIGGLPATSTSTLSRIVGNQTNTIATVVLSSGAGTATLTNGTWILRGDTLLWGGSTTSGVARAVFAAD